MAKENKDINIVKAWIPEAPNGTLFFNNSFPEFEKNTWADPFEFEQ